LLILIGPIVVFSSFGLPTTTSDIYCCAFFIISSFMDSDTRVLVPAVHTCPVLLTTFQTADLAASSISTSSKMMYGDLPPNSSATRLKSWLAFSIIFVPVAPEPVNDIIRTLGWPDKGVPTPSPSPLTRLNTPLGTSAASNISARIIAANGVSSDGFNTTGDPAAIAADNFNDV